MEHALLQEFGKTDEDPLMSAHFDVNDYINQHFGTGTSLRVDLYRGGIEECWQVDRIIWWADTKPGHWNKGLHKRVGICFWSDKGGVEKDKWRKCLLSG